MSANVGLMGALFGLAFAPFQCDSTGDPIVTSIVAKPKPGRCGEIAKTEFGPEDLRKMRIESGLLALGGVALVAILLWWIGASEN